MMDWLEFAKVVVPAVFSGFGAFMAVKVELAKLQTKMERAEVDIQTLFTLNAKVRK